MNQPSKDGEAFYCSSPANKLKSKKPSDPDSIFISGWTGVEAAFGGPE